jgi:DNA-binding NtrC family response regulator
MREGRDQKHFDDQAMELLMQYQWPGNVRELQNICERACVLSRGLTITANVIRPWLTDTHQQQVMTQAVQTHQATAYAPKTLEEMEREEILKALEHNRGNRQRTARALGIGVRTLGLKLKKWKECNLVAQTV